MKKILLLIIAIIPAVTVSAQEWKSVDLSNEWQPESAGQKALSITTYEGHHLFVYPERDMVVIAPSMGKVASMRYEPVSAKIVIRYFNERGMMVGKKKGKMMFTKNGAMGIITSSELMGYLRDSSGFIRITHTGRYGFTVEIPTLAELSY